MNEWYQQLIKPTWAPPAAWFGPVWTVLYAIIAVSFGAVFYLAATKRIPRRVAIPFGINLIANLAFTPLQFGIRSNLLAAADVALVWGSLLWAMTWVYPHRRWIAYAQLPYLLWVTFATALQFSITWLNW